MTRIKQLTLILFVSILCVPSIAMAQGDPMAELYGEGVHRFFAGDYAGAEEVLTQVVDSGSLDPRAHFYRGLVQEMLDGSGDADFAHASRLEAEGKMVVNVGMALSRIQGAVRAKIEKVRRDARVMRRQQELAAQAERRKQMPPAVKEPAAPPTPSETDPFAGGGLSSPSKTEETAEPEQPAAPSEATSDPFGDDSGPATPSTTPATSAPDDPFGTATEPPAATPAASDEVNPFGDTPAAGEDDPFKGF